MSRPHWPIGSRGLPSCRPWKVNHGKSRIHATAILFCLSLAFYPARTGAQIGEANRELTPFVDPATLDPGIPTPESVIGHGVGEKAVRYDPLVRYLKALANASPRVALTPYGETYEGRTLYYLTITSPANHARMDRIRADNAKLADPRKLDGPEEAERILDSLPGIAWMTYSIHGDELSSTDAAMQAAYQLAAGTDEATLRLMDEVVTNMVALQNPDGRERNLGSIEQLTGAVASPDGQAMHHHAISGRANHYRFDLNRDWLMLTQRETRAHMAAILAWSPHFLVDSHEMGPEEEYLMDPPRQPLNPFLPSTNLGWRERYGFDQAEAFDRHGWSYYAKDWNVDFAPIYTNSWVNFAGGAGLLYEQAGVSGSTYRLPSGHDLTYRESVHHQLTSTLANLETLRAHRREILSDYLADHQWAISKEGPYTRTFLTPPSPDRKTMGRFVDLIRRQGIEFGFATEAFKARGLTDMWGKKTARKEFPPGTLVMRSNQPLRRVVHAYLSFDVRAEDSLLLKEREELENRRDSRFYDVTAWNFPMSFGLESYWAETVGDVDLAPHALEPVRDDVDWDAKPRYGYLIDFDNAAIYDVLARLFEKQCHPRIGMKPFTFAGREYSPGAVLLRGHENPPDLSRIVQSLAERYDVDIRPVDSASVGKKGPDLGGPKFRLLHAPRIALDAGNLSSSFGAVWHLLDRRLGMRVSPLRGLGDLRKYNVLVLFGAHASDRDEIKAWVEAGGTLIASGRAAVSLMKDEGLSEVRRRRDVLGDLALYEEDLERENSARHVQVDFDALWGDEAGDAQADSSEDEALGDDESKKDEKKKASSEGDVEKLKRLDEWRRLFNPSGVFVNGLIDPTQWLGFGMGEKTPVLVRGGNVFMSRFPVQTPVRLADADHLRLSGLLWPESRERLANSAFATVERVGQGQVILFATDPTMRGWFPGMERLFLNAALLGPGLGASHPRPW